MFNPFKALGDMNAMRKQALIIQQALEKEEFEVVSGQRPRCHYGQPECKNS